MTGLLTALAISVGAAGCVIGPPRHWHDDQGGRYRYDDYDGRHRRGYGVDYRCGPCRHRFDDWDEFRSHLHGYHHVPWTRIPSVIVRVDVGWLYRG